ncbi:MACPF domain-containing protein At1g14780-like [Chenopodium quinoa]|uniref:MACPF domain-containing protein n=1 Tax=Chenopodium quinoa TaxID=63459 RepID=A0A803L1C4_CHEQI|nr:MACPF domain-containing protein At1g14780-like [Chenopodium quinoa]
MIENNNNSSNIESLRMHIMTTDGGIIDKSIASLGKGFDLTSDFRLRYCKGNQRIVLLNEDQKKQLFVPGFGTLKQPVSIDIKCDKGDHTRHQSDILDFNQMSEFFNRISAISGKIPSGLFNSMFKFESGSWAKNAANVKLLGLDGYSIVLFDMHIDRYPLQLSDEVLNDVPSTWDPPAIARFIEKYGTHVIVGISIGGQDMVLVKQDKTSKLESSELRKHLYELGDQLFTGTCPIAPKNRKTKEPRRKVPSAFNIYQQQAALSDSLSAITSKDGISVICAKRGGDPSFSSHIEWLPTVPLMPDAINFSFIPITSLLKSVSGKGFLSHAINLYLRYKPPIADLQYFLDFQSARIWAPLHSDLPLAPTTNISLPSSTLHFNIMGPKLHVNTSKVNVESKPVTEMRLYLEGMKCDRLAIHLEHLSSMPLMLQNKIDSGLFWRGSDEIADDRYSEPVQKKFSHVCTAPAKYDPSWTSEQEKVVFIVTGAQLYTKKHGSKQVLHLRLLFSKVLNFEIVQSEWCQGSSESTSQKLTRYSSPSSSGSLEAEKEQMVIVDSSLYPTGPPVPVQNQKCLRFVDTTQTYRGPQDNPGYWIATGARLGLVKNKICLQVKFSLLNICS